jgi:outer membrane protein OmpA-like peptidoglycan-associated protein
MPALGLYYQDGAAAVGIRMRAGVLRDGPPPGLTMKDPGLGGLVTTGVAARLARRGAWAELVFGGGLTGHDVVPAVEAGIGWSFAVGPVDGGPSVRYLRVISGPAAELGNAELVLVGIDLQIGKQRMRPGPARGYLPIVSSRAAPAPGPDFAVRSVENDHDQIVDLAPGCAEDPAGCPIRSFVVHDDRIVLDDRILFDVDRARVRSAGREVVAEIARAWGSHPDWRHITVEGHCDVRGSDAYNLALSQRRAERVRALLIRHGFEPDRIDAVGYGRSRPRDAGTTEEDHRRNRRVEFVIDRSAAPCCAAVLTGRSRP